MHLKYRDIIFYLIGAHVLENCGPYMLGQELSGLFPYSIASKIMNNMTFSIPTTGHMIDEADLECDEL